MDTQTQIDCQNIEDQSELYRSSLLLMLLSRLAPALLFSLVYAGIWFFG